MARETQTAKAKKALDGAAADKQSEKVTKAGGDPDAVNPVAEQPDQDAEFHEELTAAKKADAEDSPVDFNHGEQTRAQLPKAADLSKENEGPNVAGERGDSDGEDPEAMLVDSAGEQKNDGEAPLKATDTAVVTAAVQQQKSVGALAQEKAPSNQNKTSIAESPVSTPNGERVVTFATPPRIAVVDVVGEVPDEGKTSSITEEQRAKGFITPFSTVGPRVPGQPAVTNGVVPGLETVTSGIIPDATVAETDGTYMPAGAPNETYDKTVAPDGFYTGAELNAAPLQAPQERQYAGSGEAANSITTNTGGLMVGAAPITGDIVDSATGEKPTDIDGLFVLLFAHGSVMVAQKRLVEKTGPNSGTLLVHVGKQVSSIEAERIKARIRD